MTSTTHTTTVSVTTLAQVNVQSMRYTDSRVEMLSRQVNVMQAQIHNERSARDAKIARDKLTDRVLFIVIGGAVGMLISHLVLPAFAVAFLGIAPDIAREVFEFVRKLR